MFNNMKNQVREKTGRDVPKFTPQKGGLSRQSRQGSESSISSLVVDPIPPTPQSSSGPSPSPETHQIKLPDGRLLNVKDVCSLIKREEELKNKLEKKETEWTKKLEKREAEIIQEWMEKNEEWKRKEHALTEDLLKQTNELKDALKCVEECKRKLYQYQEDKDQLEGFQIQEMAKVKHLLLAKERENTELSASLKENCALVESLKSEVSRLRPFEEQVSNFEEPLRAENAELKSRTDTAEAAARESSEEVSRLRESLASAEAETVAAREEANSLAERLAKEQREKDDILLRNAQISQEVDIARQDLRHHQADMDDLYRRTTTLEASLKDKDTEVNKYKNEVAELLGQVSSLQMEAESRQAALESEKSLKETIADLELQLADRNKNVKILQQRLSDMKKTLQRELKNAEPSSNETVSNHHSNAQAATARNSLDDDVNFLYLKHVIIRFLTSREYEAQQLTKAVATLLKLSPEEEGLLKDTLEWRMSWFGSRPKLQNHHVHS